MAIAAGVKPIVNENGKPDANTVVPLLFDQQFPSWFAGVAFAAIGIGALVPAAIMSIAAANLFSRNVWTAYVRPEASDAEQARVSKIASLAVKAGAVAVILVLEPQFSLDLQLIGGVIILQTLPAVVFGLLTPWFHRWALLAGWAVGMAVAMAVAMAMLYATPNAATGRAHFGGPLYALSKLGLDTSSTIYPGLVAVVVNVAVAALATVVLRRGGPPPGPTRPTTPTTTSSARRAAGGPPGRGRLVVRPVRVGFRPDHDEPGAGQLVQPLGQQRPGQPPTTWET